MRDFERISFKQFAKDIEDNKELYDDIKIPQRDSEYTAGYKYRIEYKSKLVNFLL